MKNLVRGFGAPRLAWCLSSPPLPRSPAFPAQRLPNLHPTWPEHRIGPGPTLQVGVLLSQLKTTERTLSRSEAPPVWGRRGKESPSQLASVKTVAQASVRFFGEWPG